MGAQVGVLIIHGIGSTNPAYANKFIDTAKSRLAAKGIDEGQCVFEPVYWEPIFGENQKTLQDYLVKVSSVFQPISRFARRAIVNYLGDAGSYYPAYKLVHDEIRKCVIALENSLDANKPFIVVAHSLGAVLMSDYIYDRRKCEDNQLPDPRAETDFQRLKTLTEFITMGANIPIFKLGYNERVGIKQPSESFRWINYFSPFDILGYPLMDYYTQPENRVTIEDRKMLTGGIFSAWNWTTHSTYWENEKILAHITDRIDALIHS